MNSAANFIYRIGFPLPTSPGTSFLQNFFFGVDFVREAPSGIPETGITGGRAGGLRTVAKIEYVSLLAHVVG